MLVKLTPNVTDIRAIGRAAQAGGADGLSLINTINSIIGVDLDTLRPMPHVAGRGSHGGYCGPAVKPIALHMVHALAADPEIHMPISGIGGIQTWQDAVEFMLLGATSVQVCTAVMHYGFRIVEDMISGLEQWMIDKGFERTQRLRRHDRFPPSATGASSTSTTRWWPRSTRTAASTAASATSPARTAPTSRLRAPRSLTRSSPPPPARPFETSGERRFMAGAGGGYVNRYEIDQETCVGCNLCSLVCPVDDCISMVARESGLPSMTWAEYQARLEKGEVEVIRPPQHR